ncbi:hypothetical protein PMES_00719 [Profundibacterium mesophilum KAUST100406-0324]|uniref:Uncharacterized protein n=1 Tax=Profundibacterium mesophilum KAUST100406-0324 TaxID=1037889 RepID=A0A921NS95_9RHOB|nr:hypothetical protein PMES_00719 [Profundibacterium mesophilum KAUST100406-0324]
MGTDPANANRPHGRNALVGGDPRKGAGTGSHETSGNWSGS